MAMAASGVLDISVVIPAFNMELWIERTLDSVLGQSQRPKEVIVVDDGSTDSTAARARAFPSVRIVQQPNKGLAAARNAGARAADTEAILFLDADDLLLDGALERLGVALLQFPEAGAINPTFEKEEATGRTVPSGIHSSRVLTRRDLRALILRNPLGGNTVLRTPVWNAHPYDERLRACEDLALWIDLMLNDLPIVQLAGDIIRRRVEREGALTSATRQMRSCRKEVLDALWQKEGLTKAERVALAYARTRNFLGRAIAVRGRSDGRKAPRRHR